MHESDARAERAILSSAEAYRLVGEARDQRERADAAEAKIRQLREAIALLNSMVRSGESHSETSEEMIRAALN